MAEETGNTGMFDALVEDLQDNSGIPFAECEWATRPTGNFGTIQIDFSGASDNGDDGKIEQAVEGSVDLYLRGGRDAAAVRKVTDILRAHCGASWRKNSQQYERETHLLHIEFVFQLEEE